jgi:predicted aldo/keto reductase-like oxidoreductase
MERKLGFGCMRLPMKGNEVDYDEFNKMIDYYFDHGFNYFDTAHGYIDGKSETAIRDCLASRYKREDYVLTNKLTGNYFNKEEDIRPLFEKQLEACGVEYFDYYLMHAQDRTNYEQFQRCHAYEVAQKLKKEGKVKHVGISFHDTADVLDRILTDHPEVEIVQIQFNYADFKSPSVQSEEVYKVARKHGKELLIMEPVKGGGLVNLPDEAKKVLDEVNKDNLSYASFAIRFAASFDGVFKVLSGMSNLEQMKDNVSYMEDFKEFNADEYKAVYKVAEILNNLGGIPCTGCRYCTAGCPMRISIPDLFACYNAKKVFKDWNSSMYYGLHTKDNGKASDCIKCGQCEGVCPQHLKITELLEEVAKTFE